MSFGQYLVRRKVQSFKVRIMNRYANSICVVLVVFSVTVVVESQKTKDDSSTTQHLTLLQQHFALGMVSFALKLTQQLYNETEAKNVLFSPISMYSCLSVAHLASSGVTRRELAKLTGFPEDDEVSKQMHQGFGKLTKSVEASDKAKIKLANGVFVQKALPLKERFSHDMEKYYDNQVSVVDFTTRSTATKYINEWISDKTEGRIAKLLQKDLSDTTRIAMANALFFSAKWGHPFNNESTTVEKFDTGFGQIEVPMMHNQKRLGYLNYRPGSFEAIALPYEDYEFVMYLALPYTNQTLRKMLDSLNVQHVIAALKQPQKAFVDYKVPRMKFQRFTSMKEQLKKMGLHNFFEKGEFDNLINSTTDFSVSDVMHGAEMEANEDGTTVTAASTVILNTYSIGDAPVDGEPVQFYLNRPFLFFLNHKLTNTVMFAAVVHNPLE